MRKNPYIRTNWKDHIVDIETGDIIQEGTRFTASRANNIEDGIYNAYEYLKDFYSEMTRLQIQIEMIGRAPVNSGAFFDTLEEGNVKALKLLKESAVLQNAVSIGVTKVTVDDSSKFKAGQHVTFIDEENYEDKKITSIDGNTLTVTALQKPFKKGAYVVRSNVIIKNNKMGYGKWGTYDVDVREVV